MGTITHTFDAGQSVCVAYDVRLDGDNGTTEIAEANMFATLAEATAEYEIRLT